MWTISSCSVKKFIPQGNQITVKYSVKLNDKPEEVSFSELRGLIKPKANGKFLFWMPKLYYYFRHIDKPTKFNTWLNKNYGEEPVYSDKYNLDKVSSNMEIYLDNIGFFNSKVIYKIHSKKIKDKVVFKVELGTPYHIRSIKYDIKDSLLSSYVIKDKSKTLLKEGNIYNAYTLDDERDRISEILRNSGYYLFSRNYIQFVIDSNHRNHSMNISFKLNNIKDPTNVPGEFTERNHNRYFINSVTVIPELKPSEIQTFDTTVVKINFWNTDKTYSYDFLHSKNKKKMLKSSAFNQAIKIKPGEAYSAKDVQNTYRRLFNYQIIRTANIGFDTINNNTSDTLHKLLNCKISMQESNLNVFSIEAEGTNSSGDLGMRGNLVFLNKNIFKRAEVLRIRLNGGFEAQTFVDEGGSQNIFNTFETGIEGTVFFPRFFSPIRLNRFNQRFNPTSNLRFGYNYQRRPNYTRNITLFNLGYSWKQNLKIRHVLTPTNINFVKINPSPEFEKKLEKETNKRLKEQYSDHMILGLNYSFTYNNQGTSDLKNFEYFRFNIETSGNLLYGINSLLGSKKTIDNYYEFLGVRYSQYVRVDFDFRQYFKLRNREATIAGRIYVGSGIPYLNSEEIPYERGFYAGGANGMRGWVFRTLGPGSYSGIDQYEKLGDIQLEFNLEYRFPIYKFFHGAIFTDVGNIWTYNESETFPNGKFKINEFYKELAADVGFGMRFDFQFFIFRIDFAAPIFNPSFPQDERWRVQYLQFRNLIGNFGIGYPF